MSGWLAIRTPSLCTRSRVQQHTHSLDYSDYSDLQSCHVFSAPIFGGVGGRGAGGKIGAGDFWRLTIVGTQRKKTKNLGQTLLSPDEGLHENPPPPPRHPPGSAILIVPESAFAHRSAWKKVLEEGSCD